MCGIYSAARPSWGKPWKIQYRDSKPRETEQNTQKSDCINVYFAQLCVGRAVTGKKTDYITIIYITEKLCF